MKSRDHTARYLQLVETLGRQMSHAHGWKRHAADKLGIDPSYLSRILSGERQVGWHMAERAAQNLGIDVSYFLGDGPPEYFGISARSTPAGRASSKQLPDAVAGLIDKFETGKATAEDVYGLARAVLELPAVVQARAIVETRKPKTEQGIGALFMSASKLIDALRAELSTRLLRDTARPRKSKKSKGGP